jgi:hypothetical protein
MLGGSSGGEAPDPGTTGDEDPAPDVRLDVGSPGAGVSDDDDSCATFSETGISVKRPADIMFVVDNSPSMVQEADAVQNRLSAFSQQIVDAGIDVHVFLLTAYPDPSIPPQLDTGICIDPPLGGGGCPTSDNNPPMFSHLHQTIGSSHALLRLIDTHEQWAPIVREDSVKHVIIVSDDDSYLTASEFDTQFTALDPSYADYVLHGIVSLDDCAYADTIGTQYVTLAGMTDGILGDLCDQDWQPLFDLLSTAVIEGTDIACDWAVPEAPDGLLVDPGSIDVEVEAGDGSSIAFGPVAGQAACADVEHGFYYDDPVAPTRMYACPQTCGAIEATTEATVNIEVGCAAPSEG